MARKHLFYRHGDSYGFVENGRWNEYIGEHDEVMDWDTSLEPKGLVRVNDELPDGFLEAYDYAMEEK